MNTVVINHFKWMEAPTVTGHRFGYVLMKGSAKPAVGDRVTIRGDFGLYYYTAGRARVVEVTEREIVFDDFTQNSYGGVRRPSEPAA